MKLINRMTRYALITLCVLMPQQLTFAHNKVVVIPMAGDDVPAVIEPTAPVAKVAPAGITDYNLMANTTIDNITGLEWQREDDDDFKTWNEALDYCAGLTLDGKDDWRLPDVVELQSIVDYGQMTPPVIDSVGFPNTNSSSYWSASSRASSSASAWFVGFNVGYVLSLSKTNDYYVRCVR